VFNKPVTFLRITCKNSLVPGRYRLQTWQPFWPNHKSNHLKLSSTTQRCY